MKEKYLESELYGKNRKSGISFDADNEYSKYFYKNDEE